MLSSTSSRTALENPTAMPANHPAECFDPFIARDRVTWTRELREIGKLLLEASLRSPGFIVAPAVRSMAARYTSLGFANALRKLPWTCSCRFGVTRGTTTRTAAAF